MAVCKYCHGQGCTNQCIEEKIKKQSMKPLEAKLVFENQNIEDMIRIHTLVKGEGCYDRDGSIDIVKR
jgi:hypothetical protein